MGLRVQHSQHFVIVFIDVELHWVLVVGEKSVVTIGQISKSASEVERVLNWRFVVHWSKEVMLEGHYDNLFEESVAHQELFRCSRDISVPMLDSHSGESSLLNLESDATGQWKGSFGLFRWMNSWVGGSGENVKALVTNLVYH